MKKLFILCTLCASVLTANATEGALPGKFTINAYGDQVQFAKGNLQATTTDLGANWTWAFAANAWDYVGVAAANNAITGNGTVSANGTVDIFCWSTAASYYGIHNSTNSNTFLGAFVDWGNTMGEGWRTLTEAEWDYLSRTRENANYLRGSATVNGVHGYIFLPDDWVTPSGLSFASYGDQWLFWDTNTYTATQWAQMEAAGAVFLPAAGERDNGEFVSVSESGYYWTATSYNDDYGAASGYVIAEHGANVTTGWYADGRSVRLVYQQVEKYNLRICGKRITDLNRRDIAAEVNGVTGTVSYDPDSKTLTLTNATLTTPDVTQAIWNDGIDGLKIVVNGTCDLNTPYCIALRLDANTTIVGTNPATDTLKVRNAGPLDQQIGSTPAGTCYIALATFDNAALTVNNCTVETEGAGGILLQDSSQMTINHARVTARSIGTPSGSAQRKVMRSFKGTLEPILIDCEPIAPEGVYFDATLGGYTADGSELTRARVVIEPTEPEPEQKWENGVLPGKFSVSANKRVNFSQGNLQYKASTDTWRFAENQYNFVGNATLGNVYENSVKCDNSLVADDYTGWIDLFGWGTGAAPTKRSHDKDDYRFFTDWGTNAIANGGNAANQWRTLTKDEWVFLTEGRTNADQLYGIAVVNGINGCILLPDGCVLPDGVEFTPGGTTYDLNSYDLEKWQSLEAAGAVFLPAAGYCPGANSPSVNGNAGYYWLATLDTDNDLAFRYAISSSSVSCGGSGMQTSMSVRLVQDVAEELPTYYVAGNGSTANPWCDGLYWSPNGSAMTNGTITYHDVPAGTYEFKITDGQWGTGHEWAYGAVDATCCSANVQNGGSDSNGNIKLITSITQDITITFDGTNICVTGTFDDPNSVEITSYTIVGDNRVFESWWDVADTKNDMTETTTGVWTLTKYGVTLVANVNYEYKMVGNHSYSVFQLPAGNNNNILTVTESSNYDIVFTYDRSANTLTHVATMLTGVENTRADEIQSQKIIRDGQLLILRNGRTYNAQGAEVK